MKPIMSSHLQSNMQWLDPNLLLDLETDARHLATSVHGLVRSISETLHGLSSLTVNLVGTYKDGVCKTCDEVDSNVKAIFQLMARVEELNKGMVQVYKIGHQLREILRLLDMYEATISTPCR